jgi:serine/threonine-protein kinase
MDKRWIWPFELEEQIGAGAMGVVYRARFVKNDRRVALKLLPKEVAANATLAARFQREMEILKDLRHPHIVHCFGGTCEGDQWFYAMELIDGGSLQGLLAEQGKLPWRQVIEFAEQICAALDHAHAQGVIHRDIKPGNLLLTRSGKVKLADFGLALVAAETKLTAAGKTLGSIHYMAPEQIRGKPALSNRTDLYALGCVMFELLCGRTPFTGQAMAEILQQHLKQPAERISTLVRDCPAELDALIADLLEKSPDARPESAGKVAERLEKIDKVIAVNTRRADRNLPLTVPGHRSVTLDKETREYESATPAGWNKSLVAALVTLVVCCAGLLLSRWQGQERYGAAERQLVAALRDSQQPPEVRKFAARSLGNLGPDAHGALESMLATMNDSDPTVRVEVARSIGRIGPRDAYVMAQLRKLQERDDQPMAREAIAATLKQMAVAPSGSIMPWVLTCGALLFAGGAGYWLWRQIRVMSPPGRGVDFSRRATR